jgi:hypothetical protein
MILHNGKKEMLPHSKELFTKFITLNKKNSGKNWSPTFLWYYTGRIENEKLGGRSETHRQQGDFINLLTKIMGGNSQTENTVIS